MRIVMVLLTILTLVTTYFFFSKDDVSETITSTIPKSKESIETIDYREALLISNNDYKYLSNLKDISSNITTLEKTLENLNFNVQIQNNLNSKELKQAIYQFKERLALKKNTIGFLYYAGHGCQLNNVGYLVPTNVDIKKKIDIEYDAMNIDKMLNILDSEGNKINMVFLDACRNISTGVRGEGLRGLAQEAKKPKGRVIVYESEGGKKDDKNKKFIN